MTLDKSFQGPFEDYLERIMETHLGQGMAVAILDRRETVYQRCFGWRDRDRRLPVDQDTIFGLASVTKSFTCGAVMQLAEMGRLDEQAPAWAYCPDFHNLNQRPVTVAHLMTHSGGYFPQARITVDAVAKDLGLSKEGQDWAYSDVLADEGIRRVASRLDGQMDHIGRPGEFMSYCNDGYGVLADIIRRQGDQRSYSGYVEEHILKPLGMDRSTFSFEAPARDPNVSVLYAKRQGAMEAFRDFYDNAFVLMGGGALKSTLRDMKKYLFMLMNGGVGPQGQRILSPRSLREMTKPRIPTKWQQFCGYGLMVSFLKDCTVIRHGGSLTGVSSHLAWSPELGCGVIVLCNTSDVPVSLVADGALRWCAGWDPRPEDPWTDRPWDPETIAQACGCYRSDEGGLVEISPSGTGIAVKVAGEELPVRMVQSDLAVMSAGMARPQLRLMRLQGQDIDALRLEERILSKVR